MNNSSTNLAELTFYFFVPEKTVNIKFNHPRLSNAGFPYKKLLSLKGYAMFFKIKVFVLHISNAFCFSFFCTFSIS